MSNWEKTEGQKGLEQAEETDQYFWPDADGAHISSTGDHDTSGFHQLLTSVKNAFMHGTIELATFGENLIELGKNSTSAVIKFCAGTGEIGVIDSMLTLFADKVGVKGNSQAVLASNGESNVAASKQNTTYAGLSQMAATAPSTDADPASALLKAKCTKNSDGSTVSETYISLEAKSNGKAPVTIKASDIALNSSSQVNNYKYTAVKTDGDLALLCPSASGESIAIGAYDTSTGNPIDAGISFLPVYGTSNLPTAYMNVQQIQTPEQLIPITRFEDVMSGGFSDTPKKIGIWINGSTVYRKVVLLGACNTNASIAVAHGLPSGFSVVNTSGMQQRFDGSWKSLYYTHPSDIGYQNALWIDATNVNYTASQREPLTQAFVIIDYF